MNNLQVFSNPEFGQVRSMMIEDAPWFVGHDVAGALGYAKPRNALKAHIDADDALIQGVIDSMGRNQPTTIINESGLYSLILSSKLPSAKRFKRWVTSEVLPALRRTGRYEMEGAKATPETELPERTLTHDDYLRAASIVASCRNERLPYVLAYLKQAGIEVKALPDAQATIPYTMEEARLEMMRLLSAAREQGYGDALIAKKLGVQKNEVRRWRLGIVIPRVGRIPFIKSVVEPLIEEA